MTTEAPRFLPPDLLPVPEKSARTQLRILKYHSFLRNETYTNDNCRRGGEIHETLALKSRFFPSALSPTAAGKNSKAPLPGHNMPALACAAEERREIATENHPSRAL